MEYLEFDIIDLVMKAPSTVTKKGFTLLELLFAVAILVLVAGALFTSHLQVVRAENSAQWQEKTRFEIERLVTRVRLGLPTVDNTETGKVEWTVNLVPVPDPSGRASAQWRGWSLYPTNQPNLDTVIYLRRRI